MYVRYIFFKKFSFYSGFGYICPNKRTMAEEYKIPEELKCPSDSNFRKIIDMFDQHLDKWLTERDINDEESCKKFQSKTAYLLKIAIEMMSELEIIMDDPEERATSAHPEYIEAEIVHYHAVIARGNALVQLVHNVKMPDILTQVKELVADRYKGKITLN
jgi:hypothetical protein